MDLVLSIGGEGEVDAFVVVSYVSGAAYPEGPLRDRIMERGGTLLAGWSSALPIHSGSVDRVHARKLPVRLDRTWNGAPRAPHSKRSLGCSAPGGRSGGIGRTPRS